MNYRHDNMKIEVTDNGLWYVENCQTELWDMQCKKIEGSEANEQFGGRLFVENNELITCQKTHSIGVSQEQWEQYLDTLPAISVQEMKDLQKKHA